MSYWNRPEGKDFSTFDHYHIIDDRDKNTDFTFYELEPAVVLDVILDENHSYFKKTKPTIHPEDTMADFDGKEPDVNSIDLSFIGRVLVRPLYSMKRVEKEDLIWAIPIESNISEYPLINEIVIIGKYFNNYYYNRKLNISNLPNSSLDFSKELLFGSSENSRGFIEGNRELYDFSKNYQGPISKTSFFDRNDTRGVAGRYFWANRNIRSLKRNEGDLIIESRFGQSIRFGSYSDDRKKDVGDEKYSDYYGSKIGAPDNPLSGYSSGGGNPMILIRNRQRPLLKAGEEKKIYDKIDPLKGTSQEKGSGGYISEDINYDGSSIHITCGLTISQFKTTCFKKIFADGTEEQPMYSPRGSTLFKFPELDGDQVVINSDRLIFQSRVNETLHFSKKRYAVTTDNEYTVDANKQIVITSNTKTVLNSPLIYLGQYDQNLEPVLLGRTSIEWLHSLCNWMLNHTHWYIHGHTKKSAGRAVPDKTQMPVEAERLIALRDNLESLLSKRVFVVGGGYAPGYDVQ